MEIKQKFDNTYIENRMSNNDSKIIELILKCDIEFGKISSQMILKNVLVVTIGFFTDLFTQDNTTLIVAIVLGMMLYIFIDIFQKTSIIRNYCTDTILKLGVDENHLEKLKNDPKLIEHGQTLLKLIISEIKLRKLKQ